MLASKLLSAAGGTETLWVDDCFAVTTYTGNGSTQTITNGIDLAGNGGLVWIKGRDNSNHGLFDTARGVNIVLSSNQTTASTSQANSLTAYNASGFSIGSDSIYVNNNLANIVSWTFRKAPKFFDCGTFTRTSSTNRRINHSLGVAPGMVVIKRVNDVSSWIVYHQSIGRSAGLFLNNTNSQFSQANCFGTSDPTSSDFGIDEINALAGAAGDTWVWYAFAHDTSAEGIIQCGSFTTDASGNATVNLGWEPQYALLKRTDAADAWYTTDTMRGWSQSGTPTLLANSSSAETANAGNFCYPTATGFDVKGLFGTGARTFIYLAIRRPNKPPTTGTQVYNAIARTGLDGSNTLISGVGFSPDLLMVKNRNASPHGRTSVSDRLRGAPQILVTGLTDAELVGRYDFISFEQDGIRVRDGNGDVDRSSGTYINHFFRRAPGVFDVVCYTYLSSSPAQSHGLQTAPELMIFKNRGQVQEWYVYHKDVGLNDYLVLNSTAAKAASTGWVANVTQSAFTAYLSNTSTYTAYLWATKAGISKVGTYTGNGSSQTIDCGFTTGARFIIIKRTDSTGDWYVWDSVRGIVAANDPHLSLNTTAAEVTTNDSIDPANAGFIVNQVAATNINVNGGTYIYLAFA